MVQKINNFFTGVDKMAGYKNDSLEHGNGLRLTNHEGGKGGHRLNCDDGNGLDTMFSNEGGRALEESK